MEAYFSSLFEVDRHERSLILLLAITGTHILKQITFTDDKRYLLKNLAVEK